MQCFWEKIGVLGPIYRLAGRGLSNTDIAQQLTVTEVTVQNCITWMLHFLNFASREQLVLYGSTAS